MVSVLFLLSLDLFLLLVHSLLFIEGVVYQLFSLLLEVFGVLNFLVPRLLQLLFFSTTLSL